MVKSCCVVGCTNRSSKGSDVRFYRFPLFDGGRCAKWVAAVRRLHWSPNVHTRICGVHFVTGMFFSSRKLIHKSIHTHYDMYRRASPLSAVKDSPARVRAHPTKGQLAVNYWLVL